jgi:hypothetical protein
MQSLQEKTLIYRLINEICERGDGPTQHTFTEIKLAPASFATAFATRVLPQPGGPYRRTPVAISIPNAYTNTRATKKIINNNHLH